MTESLKTAKLERSVFFDSPEELEKTCKELDDVNKASRALGLACHFRGLEQAKVLVNNGVVFKNENMRLFRNVQYIHFGPGFYYTSEDDFMFSLLNPKIIIREASPDPINGGETPKDRLFAFKKEVEAVSEEERLKCVRYFIELNDNKVCNLQRLLYLAIINCDFKV
ncbi:MAG: hypothetical protein K2J79_04050, partial [Ruminiclostridium sp.]|nr:hypothetical protein [Ruminiclostridium sp.]